MLNKLDIYKLDIYGVYNNLSAYNTHSLIKIS